MYDKSGVEGQLTDGATIEDSVLSIYDNGLLKIPGLKDSPVVDPGRSSEGLSVAFWMNYKEDGGYSITKLFS